MSKPDLRLARVGQRKRFGWKIPGCEDLLVEAVREQVRSLAEVRAERDAARVQEALGRVEADARSGANLMPAIIAAIKAYASVGEITGVLVGVFGRFREPVRP